MSILEKIRTVKRELETKGPRPAALVIPPMFYLALEQEFNSKTQRIGGNYKTWMVEGLMIWIGDVEGVTPIYAPSDAGKLLWNHFKNAKHDDKP